MSKQLRLPTLLIITDNPSIRFWVKKYLDDQFFIISAASRQEAFEALNARLDFIIIDDELETEVPLELCKDLYKITQKGLIPILLITGRLKKSYRDKAVEAGVTDFLSDQLDLEELQTRISKGLKSASVRQKTDDLSLKIKMPPAAPTSLKDKFVLNDQALRLISAAKNEQVPICLLLVRIDQLNHPEIVSPLIDSLRRSLKEKDLLIPMSDARCLILLHNTLSETGRLLAERLQKEIQGHPFTSPQGPVRCTLSIVVSSLEASEKGLNRIIDSANKSLKTHTGSNWIISLDQESL